MNYDQIVTAFSEGKITRTEAQNLLQRLWSAMADDPTSQMNLQRQQSDWSTQWWNQPLDAQGFISRTTSTTIPPIAGPINVGPNRDAQGNIIANWGPRTELVDAEAAFRRGLGGAGLATGLGSGAFGQYLRERFRPTQAVFGAQTALGGGPGASPNAFQGFAQQTRGDVGAQAGLAFQGLLNQLRGGGLDRTSPGWARLQPWLAPETDLQEADVANLGREAARGRFGPYFADRFLPSSQRLLEEFQAGPTGAQTTDLLSFFKRAFGL